MGSDLYQRNGTIAYYIYFLTLVALKALGLASNHKVYQICFVIALGFLAIKLVLTKYSAVELIAVILLVLLSMIGLIHAKEQTYFLAVISIAGMRGINFKDLMKHTFRVHLWCTIIAIAGGMMGLLYDKTDGVMHSYGYMDYNVLFVNVFILCALVIYLRYDRISWVELVITSTMAMVGFYFSRSRTGMILFVFLWGMIALDQLHEKKQQNKKRAKEEGREESNSLFHARFGRRKKSLYRYVVLIPVVMMAISFILPALYNAFEKTKIMYKINHALTGRLFIARYYLKLYPFSLFGNSYTFWSENAGEILEIVDNLYITIYLYSGLVMLLLYIGALTWLMVSMVRRGYRKELMITAVLAVYAFMEEFPLNPSVNPFLLLLGACIYGFDAIDCGYERKQS